MAGPVPAKQVAQFLGAVDQFPGHLHVVRELGGAQGIADLLCNLVELGLGRPGREREGPKDE
ncbi:MAG: hypothetical protein IT285_05500 [Bdellovibrionales bacterium]|nr:hypothetical protein [Bdellovibrionales bacterium]